MATLLRLDSLLTATSLLGVSRIPLLSHHVFVSDTDHTNSLGNSWPLSSHFANAANVAWVATNDFHKQVRALHLASGLHGRQSHNSDMGSEAT